MLRLPRTNGFLSNPIYGSMAIVYSGSHTEPDTMLQWLLTDTYEAGHGDGSLYGKGIYAVHQLSGTKAEAGGYGRYVYKYRINIHGYIIFDRDVCEKVYGRWMQPHEQAQMLRYPTEVVNALKKREVPDNTEYSADIARIASRSVSNLVKGIVYTEKSNGRCVLIYDAATILPLGWKLSLHHGGKQDDKWNEFHLTPDMQLAYKERISTISSSSLFSVGRYEESTTGKMRLERDASGRLVSAGNIGKNNFTGKVKLPRDLTVEGNLNLVNTNIEVLPPGLEVKGDLILTGTNITSLPPNLFVGGELALNNTNITSLPPGLYVGGDLDLSNTNITSLPPDLEVYGSLYLGGSQITALPPNFAVSGDLVLPGAKMITELPPNLTVRGNLDLRDTNITSLPADLTVRGNLDLRDTNITSLPADLRVRKDIIR